MLAEVPSWPPSPAPPRTWEVPVSPCFTSASLGSRRSRPDVKARLAAGQPTDLLLSEREAAEGLLGELRATLQAARREAFESTTECARLRASQETLELNFLRVTQERDALREEFEKTRASLDDRDEEVSGLRTKVGNKRPL
mmetsp:Transcript_31008/g.89367  ORF Transcript_31008/g.89367 Transcript_31008/m.89367 type:complete len:141 (+) Transcript_31008:146-568(+)